MGLSFIRSSLFWVLHAAGTLLAILVLGFILVVARFAYGPFTLTTPWVGNFFSGPYNDVKPHITQSTLNWDKDKRELTLDLSNITLTDPLDQKIGDISQVVMVFKPLDFFNNDAAPLFMAIRRPHFFARFDADGIFHLGVLDNGTGSTSSDKDKKTVSLDEAKANISRAIRTPHRNPFGLGLFAHLAIEDANLTLIDESEMVTWNINVPSLSLKRNGDDYAGKSSLKITRPDYETEMGLALFYTSKTNRFSAAWAFDKLNPDFLLGHIHKLRFAKALSAPLTGSLSADFDDQLYVYDGALNVAVDDGHINIPSFYKDPLVLKGGRLAARYKGDDMQVVFDTIKLETPDTTITGNGALKTDVTPWQVEASLELHDLPVAKLPYYWPESAGVNARMWILENIHNGKIDLATTNVAATFPATPDADASFQRVDGKINVSGADLRYWQPLPVLNKVSATSTYDIHHFDIDVQQGEIGVVKLKPSHLTISGLDGTDQVMELAANITGPAKNILTILDRDPLHYAQKINIPPDSVSGTADGTLKMKFSLLKELPFDAIQLTSQTHISNGNITRVADLFGVSNAEVDLMVDKETANISGKGNINGIPSNLTWNEIFAAPKDKPASHAVINARAQGDDIKKFGIVFPVQTTKPFPVTITYDRWPARSTLNIKGDARDTQLSIPDMAFTKPVGAAMNIETTLEWGDGKPMRLPVLNVTGANINVKGEGTFDDKQALDRVSFDPLNVGETRAKLTYAREGDGHSLTLKGTTLDLRGFLGATDAPKEAAKQTAPDVPVAPPADEAKSLPLRVDVAFDKVITADNKAVNDVMVKGYRDAQGWAEVDAALMAGPTPAKAHLGPGEEGLTTMLVETPDLGQVLQAFDITDSIKGGKLEINGKADPAQKTRTLFGHININNFEVRNMPVLAKLLGAISPDGLEALLSGRPLGFSNLTGEYMWKKDTLVINKAHTSTGSLGMTAEGKLALDTNRLDLQGQVIPVYFLSRIISSIPVIGDLLTGGENGGLFAATYTVRGPLDKPNVSVNPVSILAPGVLRDILFTDPNITNEKKKPAATAPAKP